MKFAGIIRACVRFISTNRLASYILFMNRRDAISRVALLLGGTIVGANVFLEGCKPADRKAGEESISHRTM